jgi:orotate phosphoribosyltransferase
MACNHQAKIASALLEIGAVGFQIESPVRFASGILSPVYCDNRLLISYPDHRNTVLGAMLNLLQEQNIHPEVVAGTATAGIPHAAWLADRLRLPMVYVRSSAKGHGQNRMVEGVFTPQAQVLLVEDLVTTGGSSLAAILALRDLGARVDHILSIFTYDFPVARSNFQEQGVQPSYLLSLDELLHQALHESKITRKEENEVRAWQADPQAWSDLREKSSEKV